MFLLTLTIHTPNLVLWAIIKPPHYITSTW